MTKTFLDLYKNTDKERKFSTVDKKVPFGSEFIKDYSRILHSPFIRRLQGKMQLLPVGESDVLRTRLTHSYEVADVAVAICDRLNASGVSFLESHPIDRNLVSAIALAHDIGHPPFGHDGETALNNCMRHEGAGEFEGNAQTLRIVSKLENRLTRHQSPSDVGKTALSPNGLNLTFRTLAGFIKYDRPLKTANHASSLTQLEKGAPYDLKKGYYPEEAELVSEIKSKVITNQHNVKLDISTIECQIMDIADDIAYSTYDLEDAMVAGIVIPFDVIFCNERYISKIKDEVNKNLLKKYTYQLKESDVSIILLNVFREFLLAQNPSMYDLNHNILHRAAFIGSAYRESKILAENSILRRSFTEYMIQSAVEAISVKINYENPELSKLEMNTYKMLEIECLKMFNYFAVINSQLSKMHSHRGQKIVSYVFDALRAAPNTLLPNDEMKDRYASINDHPSKMRFICDFVAQMTDEEALSFYRRISTTDRTLIYNLHYPMR